jgi:hypothetical protein
VGSSSIYPSFKLAFYSFALTNTVLSKLLFGETVFERLTLYHLSFTIRNVLRLGGGEIIFEPLKLGQARCRFEGGRNCKNLKNSN